MICCYLLYSGLHASAEDALACYDEKRTKDRKGVTIPSQRRYVQYFAKLIQCGLKYERTTLQLCEIRFADAYALHSQGTVNCSISVLHDSSSVKIQTLLTHAIDFRKNLILEINNPPLSISGDIKVELTHRTSRKKIFHFWFNTYFVCDAADIESDGKCRKLVYTLHKNEIDDAHKDKEHKSFSEDFKNFYMNECVRKLVNWINRPGDHDATSCYACVNYTCRVNRHAEKNKIYKATATATLPVLAPENFVSPRPPTPDRTTEFTAMSTASGVTYEDPFDTDLDPQLKRARFASPEPSTL